MALWKVFIDDTADQHKKQYVIASAFIAKIDVWQKFQRKWNQTLRRPPRIEYFHGKELRRLQGEFLQFQDKAKWPGQSGSDAANSKRDALRDLIASHPIIGCGVGVNIPAYEHVRETHPRAKRFLSKDAFEYTIQAIIYEVATSVLTADPKARIAFVSDSSNKASRYTEVYLKWKEANPKTAKHMLGISHFDDEKWPGLQAADMGASTVKMCFDEFLLKGETLTDFPLRDRFYKIATVGENYLLSMLNHQSAIDAESIHHDGSTSV